MYANDTLDTLLQTLAEDLQNLYQEGLQVTFLIIVLHMHVYACMQ